MATRKKKTTGKAIAKYDEALAKYSQQFAKQEASQGGGKFFSLKGGVLSLDGNETPGSQISGIVLDAVIENSYPAYDIDDPRPIECFAIGRDEETLAPSPDCSNPQAPLCSECGHNKFGSADNGRGKACKNRRRLAILQAGDIEKDDSVSLDVAPAALAKKEVTYLSLPPTALKPFGSYVKTLAAKFDAPPFVFATRIKVSPDTKTQVRCNFDLDAQLPSASIPKLIELHEEQRKLIGFAPVVFTEDDGGPSKKKSRGKKPRSKKGRSRAKY